MSNKDYSRFWQIMELCDWSHEGNDDKVLAPVIAHLSKLTDEDIFAFEDMMCELLYAIDTKQLADECAKADPHMSDDSFLSSRCVALINGQEFYAAVLNGDREVTSLLWDGEFESLLYIAAKAWAKKQSRTADEFPYFSPTSYETGSNAEGWKGN